MDPLVPWSRGPTGIRGSWILSFRGSVVLILGAPGIRGSVDPWILESVDLRLFDNLAPGSIFKKDVATFRFHFGKTRKP